MAKLQNMTNEKLRLLAIDTAIQAYREHLENTANNGIEPSPEDWMPEVLSAYDAIIDHPDRHNDLMLVIAGQLSEIKALREQLGLLD